MTSKTKTILTFLILIAISLIWFLAISKYLLVPLLIIVFSIISIIRIKKSGKNIQELQDKEDPIKNLEYDKNAPTQIQEFKYSINDNYLYLDRAKNNKETTQILKIDFGKRQLVINGFILKKIELTNIDYISLMVTKTIKTQRNIISLSYKSKNKLNEILIYVCPPESSLSFIKTFFMELAKRIGKEANLKIKIIEK